MTGSIGAYLTQVDQVLAAGQSLFAAPVTAESLTATDWPSAPSPPPSSGLALGVGPMGGVYEKRWRAVTQLDDGTDAATAAARLEHHRAGAAMTELRQTAHTRAAAIAPSAQSPAGARLLVATMDERLDAMQRQLATAKAQQRILAARLRQLAGAYRLTAPHPAAPRSAARRWSTPEPAAPVGIRSPHHPGASAEIAAAAPSVGVPHLTRDSTPRQVAARILWEAHRRGYSRHQAIAILSTALQESALNPKAKSPNGLWESIFQQDASYRGRHDPNSAIAEFFDRLAMKGGPSSPDIWKSIFWLQQRPGEPSADAAYAHGRQEYLTEIRSRIGAATRLYDALTTRTRA